MESPSWIFSGKHYKTVKAMGSVGNVGGIRGKRKEERGRENQGRMRVGGGEGER